MQIQQLLTLMFFLFHPYLLLRCSDPAERGIINAWNVKVVSLIFDEAAGMKEKEKKTSEDRQLQKIPLLPPTCAT